MWEAAVEYFEWIKENPLIEVDYKGKDAERVEIPHTRPFTIHGLCLYLDCNVQYFNDFQKSIQGKDDELSIGFSVVITRIMDIIYRQKFKGAACGFYNHNIIARDLGLADKQQTQTSISINPMNSDEQKELNKLFNNDAKKD